MQIIIPLIKNGRTSTLKNNTGSVKQTDSSWLLQKLFCCGYWQVIIVDYLPAEKKQKFEKIKKIRKMIYVCPIYLEKN